MSEKKSIIATPMFISNLETILDELGKNKEYIATIGNLTFGIIEENENGQLFYIERKRKWYRVSEEEKEETKRNIEKWEKECQDYLDKGDVMSATWCRILANNLRENLGEEKLWVKKKNKQ